jgi:hypothetical protein
MVEIQHTEKMSCHVCKRLDFSVEGRVSGLAVALKRLGVDLARIL